MSQGKNEKKKNLGEKINLGKKNLGKQNKLGKSINPKITPKRAQTGPKLVFSVLQVELS